MKILITGVLPWSVWVIAQRIARGGHDVTVVGEVQAPDHRPAGVSHVKMNTTDKETARYIAAAGFEAVIFFFACQCEDRRKYGAMQGRQLDLLFDIYYDAANTSLRHFILVTDQRVFGAGQMPKEGVDPLPDSPTGVMMKAAEACVTCGSNETLRTLVVRTTSLYAPGDPTSFFGIARVRVKNKQELVLAGTPGTKCDFLHAEDFGVFLEHAVSMELTGVIHVKHGEEQTYGDIIRRIRLYVPELSVSYVPEKRCEHVLQGQSMSGIGWVPRHDCREEMEELCSAQLQLNPTKRAGEGQEEESGKGNRLGNFALKCAEILILGALAVWLTELGRNNALIGTVDYMLLYVILIGFMHGRAAGMTAAVLGCIWYGVSFVIRGGAPSDLLFNTDHWVPMGIYILSGGLIGYAQDRQKLKMEMLEKEHQEISRERDFMEGIYRRTYEDRNQLKEQIYHYRDSYGRIYQITRELDTLQPVQVFLSTLHVLESTLHNKSVAIYECRPETSFIRLVVRSREMKGLAKSLNLDDLELMRDALREGRLFFNRSMQAGYPVYALPVQSGDELIAVLMLWNVPFDQQSMYMENLLSVVTGLVQSALVRAMQYYTQLGHLYYDDTHILMPEAFRSALGIYQSIQKSATGEHFLVRLHPDQELSLEAADARIGKIVRGTDVVGRLDDGCYYVLFPQATVQQLPNIEPRFARQGIRCEVIAEDMTVLEERHGG